MKICANVHAFACVVCASLDKHWGIQHVIVQLLIESLLIRYALYACVNIFVSLILMSILANERNKLIEQQKTNSQKDI